MVNYETIAQIHACIKNDLEEMQKFIDSIAGLTSDLAMQTREEWQNDYNRIEKDRQEFLELASKNPLQAIEQFHEYLFPLQLEVKRQLESL